MAYMPKKLKQPVKQLASRLAFDFTKDKAATAPPLWSTFTSSTNAFATAGREGPPFSDPNAATRNCVAAASAAAASPPFAAFQAAAAGPLTVSPLSSRLSFAAAGIGPAPSLSFGKRLRNQHATGNNMAYVSPSDNGVPPTTASSFRHGASATAMRLVASSFKRKIVSRIAAFEKRSITVDCHSFLLRPFT